MDCSLTCPALPHNNQPIQEGPIQQNTSSSVDLLANKISEITLSRPITHADLVRQLQRKLSQRNINLSSELFRLPLDTLGIISSYLPEFSDINPFFQTCTALFLLKPELIARDFIKASQFISDCCNAENLQQLIEFLSECRPTSFASTKLYLSLDGFWESLPEALQLIQTKFPTLVCLDFTPKKEKTTCKPWTVDTINHILFVSPRVNCVLLREINAAEISKITLPQTLTEVELQSMTIDTTALNHYLQNSSELIALTLESCQISRGTSKIQANKVQKLTLSNPTIDKETFHFLLSAFESLTELELINCKNISEESLALIKSPQLKRLNLSNSKITDQSLTQICEHCTSLEELNLFGCGQITTEIFQTLAFPPSLRFINVSWTAIDDKGLHNILCHCTNLREFSSEHCKKLTHLAHLTM